MGLTHWHASRFALSIEHYQKALDLRRKLHGEKHAAVADTLGDLGDIHYKQRDYAKAIAYHQQALNLRLALFGREHSDVAASLENLGDDNQELIRIDKALDYNRQALAIRRKVQGERPSCGSRRRWPASAACNTAEESSRVPSICTVRHSHCARNAAGVDHPARWPSASTTPASPTNAWASMIRRLEVLKRAAGIRNRVFGPKHALIASTLGALGTTYYGKGDFAAAMQHHQTALTMRRELKARTRRHILFGL